jgi:predicted protein tyrosine phosphatase
MSAPSGIAPFDWITPDLAVGGCFEPHSAEALARFGVTAVIDLRAEACDDGEALQALGIRFLHLPTPDHGAIAEAMLDEGLAFAEGARTEGRRLLVHCQHGIGRSPLMALCIMVSRGWSPASALVRAKAMRARLSPNPVQYEAWAAWLGRWKARHDLIWPIPDFEAFALVAYRHLAVP